MAKVDMKQVAGVAKKNAVSITAGVVALAALAVPFVVADPWVSQVKSDLEQRASVARQVDEVVSKQRPLPKIDPDAAEVKNLETFPTKGVIEAGQKAVKHLEDQSKAVLAEALRVNTHEPLVPMVFRAAPGAEMFEATRQFRLRYLEVMPNQLNQLINARVPYLTEEVTRRVQEEQARIQQTRALRQGGQIINQEEIQRLQAKAAVDVPKQMRDEVAQRHALYVSPDTWTASPDIVPGASGLLRPESIWFAQLGLWIQEDVAKTVNGVNAGSKSVFTSPVKHLVKVAIPMPPTPVTGPYVLNRAAGGEGGQATVPVTKVDPAAALTFNKAMSLTGRTSNGLYDVVHYQMVVRVSESHVAQFLAEISRNKLHYVLNVDLRAVDSPAAATMGFIYGPDRVVELAIEVEALMLRSWTDKWMPKPVKQMVGIEEAPPPAAGAPGGF